VTAGQYWRLSRPVTLLATASPVLLGTAAAAARGPVAWPLAAGFALVALLLQVGTNLFNEAADYRSGVDDPASEGIAGVIVHGELDEKTVRHAALLTLGAALAVGLALAAVRGPWLLALGLAALVTVYAYNAGRRPVSATAWGELLVFAVMGPVEVAAAELAASGAVTWSALFASGSIGLTVAGILLANNLRDAPADAVRGRRTLVVRLGRTAAARLLAGMAGAAIAWPVVLALLGGGPAGGLVALLAAPWAVDLGRRALAAAPAYGALLPRAARLHLFVGLALAAGFLLLPGRLL
jgi:1,4-dihydroxy-2-naphthoate octaprenyltransferase